MKHPIDSDGRCLPIKLDSTSNERLAYLEVPEPDFFTYGLGTRRDFLNLLGRNGGVRA